MALFSKKNSTAQSGRPDFDILPEHIGIIMDGNGRWAKKRGLPRSAGHKAGAEVFRNISKECGRLGIKHATFYAFSTENWRRPKEEVDALAVVYSDTGSGTGDTTSDSTSRVNINTATLEELTTLPGIGDTRARAIIDYREQNGAFGNIEDIMQVTGIKEKSFSKIKDSICVK